MTANISNQVPFLRTSRTFPEVAQPLAIEVNKSYVDIANCVNERTIGLFSTGRPVINGESWFLSGNKKQQSFRQVYQFTATGNIPHGINTSAITGFTKCQGEFTDGTNWYGVIFASSTTITGQVSFYITPTNIVVGAGAGAPTITAGIIILEWLSQT